MNPVILEAPGAPQRHRADDAPPTVGDAEFSCKSLGELSRSQHGPEAPVKREDVTPVAGPTEARRQRLAVADAQRASVEGVEGRIARMAVG